MPRNPSEIAFDDIFRLFVTIMRDTNEPAALRQSARDALAVLTLDDTQITQLIQLVNNPAAETAARIRGIDVLAQILYRGLSTHGSEIT